jgi:hypothetical protein
VGVVVFRGLAIGAVAIAKPVGTVRRNERSAAVGTGNMIIVIGLANNNTKHEQIARLHPIVRYRLW